MRTTLLALVLVIPLALASVAVAEPPAPMDDRVKILTVEMNRGPAEELAPYLTRDAHHLTRRYALRALGRIGDRGKAPEMLAAFLAEGRDLEGALWAAGIAQTDKLFDAIAKHLTDEKPSVAAAAAEALGWTKKGHERLVPLLQSKHAEVRAGALMGLARIGEETTLEAVVSLTQDDSAHVRRAADFACWMLASARKRARTAPPKDADADDNADDNADDDPEGDAGDAPAWDGEPELLIWFLAEIHEDDPERRLAGLRALGTLLPAEIERGKQMEVVYDLLNDPDPRVTQETVSRVFRSREGEAVDRFLAAALGHADPSVRSMAADALAEHGTDDDRAAVHAAFLKEQDLRVRDDMAVALAKLGDDSAFAKIENDPKRIEAVEPVYRQMTRASVLLAGRGAMSLGILAQWVTPESVESGDVHPIVAMTVIDAFKDKPDGSLGAWLGAWISADGPFDFGDPYIAATAIAALAARADFERLGALCRGTASKDAHGEVRLALAKAFGVLAGAEGVPDELKAQLIAWLQGAMTSDPSAWVQDAARSALETLGQEVPPTDFLKATDWQGLPTPSRYILHAMGLSDIDRSESQIGEKQILQIADVLFALRPKVAFETTQGTFKVELEPESAPVHCVSLVLSAADGTYANTRWHRVVPSFVIQGGDPHGHGAGNSGYFVPDEITRVSYERGVLGMPKSRKDDGGCQLFFMHSPYIPLDGRYTAYGRVVEGLDVVDKIRVGDRILEARVELAK